MSSSGRQLSLKCVFFFTSDAENARLFETSIEELHRLYIEASNTSEPVKNQLISAFVC